MTTHKSALLIKEKDVVVPGDELAQGMDYLPGQWTYRKGDYILAERLGLINIEGRAIKVIPLSGKYVPKVNDIIIGKVIDVTLNGWRIETNSAYSAFLSIKDATSEFINRGADLTKIFDLDDNVVAKIINVTSQKLIDLTTKAPGLKKMIGGRVIIVNPNKVPRVIGKQGSMISMIKDATNCKIVVGQNGIVWMEGEQKNEVVAIKAIRKIENEAHISGLTDKIKMYLEEQKKQYAL